jgi:hypothetical protein
LSDTYTKKAVKNDSALLHSSRYQLGIFPIDAKQQGQVCISAHSYPLSFNCAERTEVGQYRRRASRLAYVSVRRMGYRLKDVAGYLGRDAAAIATMLSRMNERLAGDIQEKREIERLGKIVDSYKSNPI